MSEKKVIKKLQKAIQKSFEKGIEAGEQFGYSEGYNEGFDEGVAVQKEQVQTRLAMLQETYMATGKGTKAVAVREIAEFLAFEYNEEEAIEADKRDNESWF